MLFVAIGAAVRRARRCGAARLAHPARALATLGLALAILASLALVVPRNDVHAAPLGAIGAGVRDEGGGGGGTVELPGTRKGLPKRTSLGFLNARLPWTFEFPRDHAAHFGFQSEWWYYTGHLRADDGRRFGYELTFFRYGLRPGDPRPGRGQSGWRGNQVYPVHLALTDERGKRFVYDERFAREALGMGRGSARALDVAADGWTLRGNSPFVLRAESERVGVSLVQVAEKAPAVHGHRGVSLKAGCVTCASHYYSMTRLRTSGALRYGGRVLHVSGVSWMDHEFGSDELQSNQVGWDWFSLQLDDRREIMSYRLRMKDGSVAGESSGSLVDARGGVRYLGRDAVVVDRVGVWVSPHTGAVYPSGWRVRVGAGRVDVMLVPVVLDQELVGTSGGISYWEGAVDVRDTGSGRVLGAGYVELTGYAGAISL
ncbi:MAG TPA: lipocalin-like domain-containing protein [Candidatus Elarobacter sp.]|nr:lipocalin-like domain-containing protein [Candidatus Elarobacter sp.]